MHTGVLGRGVSAHLPCCGPCGIARPGPCGGPSTRPHDQPLWRACTSQPHIQEYCLQPGPGVNNPRTCQPGTPVACNHSYHTVDLSNAALRSLCFSNRNQPDNKKARYLIFSSGYWNEHFDSKRVSLNAFCNATYPVWATDVCSHLEANTFLCTLGTCEYLKSSVM